MDGKASLDSERLLCARARAMTEAMGAVCACPDRASAAVELDGPASRMTHPSVAGMKVVAKTARREGGILSRFSRNAANAAPEGLNSVIQPVKRAARGFGSVSYFEAVVYLGLGRLDFSAQTAVSCATH